MKRCNKCDTYKPREEFHVSRRYKDGLQTSCKACLKAWRLANMEKVKANERKQQAKRSAKKKEYRMIYNWFYAREIAAKKEAKREADKERQKEYKERAKEARRERYANDPEYRAKVLERNRLRAKKQEQRDKKAAREREYSKDPLYNIKKRIRKGIRRNFEGGKLPKRYVDIVGMTFEQLVLWFGDLEGKHMDHIIPISWADNNEDVLLLNHYSNLRMIDAVDNLKRSNTNITLEEVKSVMRLHPHPERVRALYDLKKPL